jgi:hypothetical protein
LKDKTVKVLEGLEKLDARDMTTRKSGPVASLAIKTLKKTK